MNHKFWGFILILSVPWGHLRTKCPCHTTFVHRSGTFLICFCSNTDISSDVHHRWDGFILIYMNTLSIWSCKIKVDEVHSTALIHQNLEILGFGGPPVWPIIFHQHTDITTWNKTNITGKIFISRIRYLKMLINYLSALNILLCFHFAFIRPCLRQINVLSSIFLSFNTSHEVLIIFHLIINRIDFS